MVTKLFEKWSQKIFLRAAILNLKSGESPGDEVATNQKAACSRDMLFENLPQCLRWYVVNVAIASFHFYKTVVTRSLKKYGGVQYIEIENMNITECFQMRKRRSIDKTPGRSHDATGKLTLITDAFQFDRRINLGNSCAISSIKLIFLNVLCNTPSGIFFSRLVKLVGIVLL